MLLSTPVEVVVPAAPPVKVKAYTESLCIDCRNFFQKDLKEAFSKLGPKVIDLEIIPFGNAKLDELNQAVTCQHGQAECDANSWEQCAVEMYSPLTYVDFIGCLEKSLPMGSRDIPFDESKFRDCADEAGIEFDILKKCHDNPLQAYLLQKEYSEKTPDHQFVPWVLINGKFWDEDKGGFLEMICKEYSTNGGSHPACASIISPAEMLN